MGQRESGPRGRPGVELVPFSASPVGAGAAVWLAFHRAVRASSIEALSIPLVSRSSRPRLVAPTRTPCLLCGALAVSALAYAAFV